MITVLCIKPYLKMSPSSKHGPQDVTTWSTGETPNKSGAKKAKRL